MKQIKRKYLHPKLLLYKYRGCLENSLSASDMSRARNIILTKHQNEVSTLTFTILRSATSSTVNIRPL